MSPADGFRWQERTRYLPSRWAPAPARPDRPGEADSRERLLEAPSSTGHGSVRPIPQRAEVMRQLAAPSGNLTQQETLA